MAATAEQQLKLKFMAEIDPKGFSDLGEYFKKVNESVKSTVDEQTKAINALKDAAAGLKKQKDKDAADAEKQAGALDNFKANEQAKYAAKRIQDEQDLADKTRKITLNSLKQIIEERNSILNAASKQKLGTAISDIMAAESSDRKKQLAELKQSMIERASLEDKDKKERLDRQAAVNRQLLENERIFAEELRKQELAEMRRRMESRVTMSSGFAAASANIYRPASDYSRSMIAGMSAAANPPAAQLPATPPAPDVKPWNNLLSRIVEINLAYRTTNLIINELGTSLRAIPRIGIELESTKASLTASMGKTGMEIALDSLRKESERTGMNIEALRESFRNFNASTSLSGVSLESTWKMFQNINTTATALHFSTDKVTHTFLALSQMFNKGKVQSEELVKQLGNLLPGAFAAFQKANQDLFTSPQDLADKMKQGLVTARDTIEKFTTFYAERFQTAFVTASDGLNANVNRMQNSFITLGEAIYNVSGGAMNSFVKGVTEVNKYLEAAVKGENDFVLISKTLVDTIGIALVGSFVKLVYSLGKAKYEIVALEGAMAVAKTAALDLGIAMKAISGPAILTGLASAVAYFHEIGVAKRDILSLDKEQNKTLTVQKALNDLNVPIALRAEKSPAVITARKEVDALKKEIGDLQKGVQQGQTKINLGGFWVDDLATKLGEATKKLKGKEEELSLVFEEESKNIYLQDQERFKALSASTVSEKTKSEMKQEALKAEAAQASLAATIARQAGDTEKAKLELTKKFNKEAEAEVERMTESHKARTAGLETVIKDNQAKIEEANKLLANPLTDARNKETIKANINAYNNNITDAKQRIADSINILIQEQAQAKEKELNAKETLDKKDAAASKRAATEKQRGLRQDIKAEDELNKTVINTAKLQTKALDDEYTKRTITFDDYFNRKQATLDKEYIAEKENLLKIQALAKQTGKRGEEVKAQQDLIRLDENKAAADEQIARDRTARTEEYKTQLADIRDQYYQILGVENEDNEITKNKLRLLRQEIELKAKAGDLASKEALRQFDSNQYNKGLIKDMAVAQQGMDANQNKLNEEIARTNALENVGRISSIQGALDRTKANEKYIKSQEKVIQNLEEELSKPSSFEKSNQLTEKLRKAKAELENFKLTANEVATAVENSMGNAFEKSFTGIVDGSMNASQAFKAFATSIVQDIIKMTASAVRAELLSPLLKMAFSGFASMAGGLFTSAAPAPTPILRTAANGNVFSGAGISAYSGSVVSSPTIFPFAAGAGLIGEAGPEAVLPLKRNSQGKLGVSLDKNGQNSAGNVYYINTTVNTNSNASPNEIANKTSEAIIRAIAKQEISSAARPGNALNKVTKYG